MNILEALHDVNLLGADRDPATWRTWDAVLRAAYALPMTEEELAIFQQVAEREPPEEPVRELWCICGRRSGKTRTAADLVTFIAAFPPYQAMLSRGERALCMLLAADRGQAGVALDYIKGNFTAQPLLRQLVERETATGLDLSNGARIEIRTSSYRSVRGPSIACVVMDETSFWRSDEYSSNPDVEVYRAVMPGMGTIDGAMLIGISTPYRRAGLLWQKFEKHFGKPGDVLVVKGSTTTFNPSFNQRTIDDALEADPEAARAEWQAEFRKDISSFIDRAVIEACVEPGRYDNEPSLSCAYYGTIDPSGGGGKDSMTLCIAHQDRENSLTIIDCVREWRPSFDPYQVVAEIAGLLGDYRVSVVSGDKFGGDWPAQAFAKLGIVYENAGKTKAEFYLNALPQFMRRAVRLPDDSRLINQLAALERRVRIGRDVVDHAVGGHDDLANVVCAAIFPAVTKEQPTLLIMDPFGEARVSHDSRDTPAQAAARERRNAAVEGEDYKMPTVHMGRLNPNIFRG